jgi:hypothetical protein
MRYAAGNGPKRPAGEHVAYIQDPTREWQRWWPLTGANRDRMVAIGLTAALLFLIVVFLAVYVTR